MSAPRQLLILLVALAVAQCVWYWPRLPEVVPSHFDAAGHVNGWTPKGFLVGIYLGVLVLVSGLLAGLVPSMVRAPGAYLNLPNKAYWLAPERVGETREYLQHQFGWMAVLTAALMIAVFEMAFRAALREDHQIPPVQMWGVVGVYVTWMLVWTLRLVGHFERTSEPSTIG